MKMTTPMRTILILCGLLAGAASMTYGADAPATGTLYNGIVLPEEWPPRDQDPASAEPMRVPYLEKPPTVIPVDTGRQLFVDDFLIESTDLTRTFHTAKKHAGNPVFKPETPAELNPRRRLLPRPRRRLLRPCRTPRQNVV